MRTDLKKCGAHNLIHGDRETCPKCAEVARASLHARGVADFGYPDVQPGLFRPAPACRERATGR
jgi:hypothetical protein